MRPLLLALPVLLAGCASTAPSPSSPPTPETPPVATSGTAATADAAPDCSQCENKAIEWVDESAEYHGMVLSAYRLAHERLDVLVAGRETGTWAVALDADETVISNVAFQKELAGRNFDPALWKAWTERREATALPGVAAFLARVRELGGRIVIVTNRRNHECPATEDNFRALDLPFDVMLCRVDTHRKEPRWKRVEEGTAKPGLPPVEILLWLGDNIQDFPGGKQTMHGAPASEWTDFGDRFILLPNPMYGSWD